MDMVKYAEDVCFIKPLKLRDGKTAVICTSGNCHRSIIKIYGRDKRLKDIYEVEEIIIEHG